MFDTLPKALFVTGTDTDCGKTLIASALIHAYRDLGFSVVGMKPAASGSSRRAGQLVNEDVESLKLAANVSLAPEIINPYIFEPAISPHFAAAEAGVRISLATILDAYAACRAAADVVIVEGAGGWRVPLADDLDMATLATAIGAPVILVSGLRLGCISHTLLTLNDINATGCQAAGWVANLLDKDYRFVNETIATVAQRSTVPLIAKVPFLPQPNAQRLGAGIDLEQLVNV